MESIVFNLAERVLDRLASHAYQEICLARGVKVELHKLKRTLSTITNVLLDAEEKQKETNANSRGLTEWLGRLKDVCYDIDDALDKFEYQRLRMRVLNRGSIKEKVRNLFLRPNSVFFDFKMGHEIKDIRASLDEIEAEKDRFDLSKLPAGDSHGVHMERETYSAVYVPDIIGREDDKEKMIIHLLKDTGRDDDNVSVISIYGSGGLGKTTLAQLVYNDNRIMENFALKMWICVSDDFNNRRLISKMIALATNEKCVDNERIEHMQIKLQNALSAKIVLLVLDDVWDGEPTVVTLEKWNSLKLLLKVGANRSKIIVTTRNK